jgi:hypothetical protein
VAAIGPSLVPFGLANLENNLPDSIYDGLWLASSRKVLVHGSSLMLELSRF